ncbi:hypothetical protein ACHAPQ_009576 [Fusarium lateritium]
MLKALEQGAFKLSHDQIKNLVLKSSGTVATGVPMPMDWVNRKDFIMANGDKPASQRTSEKGNAAIDKDWTIPIPAA